jgi:hypothetical protein
VARPDNRFLTPPLKLNLLWTRRTRPERAASRDRFFLAVREPNLNISGVRLDERILRDFRVGVFIGIRKSDRGMHAAFFVNRKDAQLNDLETLNSGLEGVPGQLRKAYRQILRSSAKVKKRKKKNASGK